MASRPSSAFSQAYTAVAVCAAGTPVPFGVRIVRMEATTDCYVWIGPNVSGTLNASNGMLLRTPTYGQEFGVYAGDLITVVQAVAAGTLNVSFMAPV